MIGSIELDQNSSTTGAGLPQGLPSATSQLIEFEYVAKTKTGDARVVVRVGSAEVEILVPRSEIGTLTAYLLRPLKPKRG